MVLPNGNACRTAGQSGYVNRQRAARCRAVAQLSVVVPAPTLRATTTRESAHMIVAGGDG